jgi:large subunit ribosomal protein L13
MANAVPPKTAKITAVAATVVNTFCANQRLALVLPLATLLLFRSPAELAVGLALKEMRYGPIRPIRPGDLQRSLRFLRSRPAGPVGIRHLLGRQYRGEDGYHHAAALGRLRGFSTMKTYVATAADRQRDWYVVDAEGQTLGRLATRIADALRGKRKPEYTPHVDTGDFIVVVNAEKIHVTGRKLEQKRYWRHSGYPGGIKSRTLAEMLERRPEEVIRKAVKGMLPRNRLARQQLTKLKVYAGPEHPHAAQQPKPMDTEE